MKNDERIKVDVYCENTGELKEENVIPNSTMYMQKDFLIFRCHVCGCDGSLRKRENGTIDFYSQYHAKNCTAGKRKDFIEFKLGKSYFDYLNLLDLNKYKEEKTGILGGGGSAKEIDLGEPNPKTEVRASDASKAIRSLKHFISDIIPDYLDNEKIPLGPPTKSISILKKDLIIQRKYYDHYKKVQDLSGIKILFDIRPTKISEEIKNQFKNTIFLQDSRSMKNLNDKKYIFMLSFPSLKSYEKFSIKYFQENKKRKVEEAFKRPAIFCNLEYVPGISEIIGYDVYRSFVNPKAIAWLDEYNI